MFGNQGQNWRQIMQMPQPEMTPTGSMFPIRGPGGGWMMPGGPSPFIPRRLQPPAPAPAAPAQSGPLSFVAGQGAQPMGVPGFGLGGMSDASRGWSPGFDGMGWGFGGFGTADGSSGWGGLLGLGLGSGLVGQDMGSLGGPDAAGAIGSGGGYGNDSGGWGLW